MNGWSVAHCNEQFERLQCQAFWRRAVSNIPMLGSLLRFVLAYLTYSLYDRSKFAQALSWAFSRAKLVEKGNDERMKVAVIERKT